MNARDSSGRNISLVNDDESTPRASAYRFSRCDDKYGMGRLESYPSAVSSLSTPSLLRSDSYDVQNTYDLASPITPLTYNFGAQSSFQKNIVYPDPSEYEYKSERHSIFDACPSKCHSIDTAARPTFLGRNSKNSYDEEHTDERTGSGKRYPCRYKDSHTCDKTFSTSGHASRHSKIHTAQKAVQCDHPGCYKKFTRADNMRQHLETHFKDSRASAGSYKMSSSKLTIPAGVKKAAAVGARTS